MATDTLKYSFNLTEENLFNVSVDKIISKSEVTTTPVEQFFNHASLVFVFGTIIFLSNITVVISSGLILKKGQEPKSTYLLLGNVSLADTIIGLSMIFGAIVGKNASSDPLCIIQLGMLVSPTMVSKFTVGLIAVDRYIYILHGLYYKRWCNTTRVRICIAIAWLIGTILGFLPATGWINTELTNSRCYYVTLFPGAIILLNSLLSIVPIVLVAILYTIILIRALRNFKEIKANVKKVGSNSKEKPELRINRGNGNIKKMAHSVKHTKKINNAQIKKSASFDDGSFCYNKDNKTDIKAKSNDDLGKANGEDTEEDDGRNVKYESEISIQTISSTIPDPDICKENTRKPGKNKKAREPNKWRAITIVMLTCGSFIITWMPFFVTAVVFVFCEEKLTNPKCLQIRVLLGGPIAALAFLNSILNPLIYAWWHKGFQRTIQTYFRRFFHTCFHKNI